MTTATSEETCFSVAVLDANMLIASVLPNCKAVIMGRPEDSYTAMQLLTLFQVYNVCMYVPERIIEIAPSKITKRCREIGKKKGVGKEKLQEAVERAKNSLTELLSNLDAEIVAEEEYAPYLNHSLVENVGDVNDDNHLVALALYLKEKYSLEKVYVLSRDLRIPNIGELQEAGIIVTLNLQELEN